MLATVFDLLTRETEQDRQRRELLSMRDHELADLGISRDQIEGFVRLHAGASEPHSPGLEKSM